MIGPASRVLARALLLGLLLTHGAEGRSIGHDLLQTRIGAVQYAAAIARLRLRDAGEDARRDLAAGNRDLYCVGTIACWPPGVDQGVPSGFSIHATATTGCIIVGGDFELAYRAEEQRYVTAYNRAKLEAFEHVGLLEDQASSKAQ